MAASKLPLRRSAAPKRLNSTAVVCACSATAETSTARRDWVRRGRFMAPLPLVTPQPVANPNHDSTGRRFGRLRERGVERLEQRGDGDVSLVAHVRDAEGFSLELAVAAI